MEKSMSDIFGTCWVVLVNIYREVHGAGFVGSFTAFVVGLVTTNKGVAITGREESFSGPINYGHVNLTRLPAIEGTAKTWVGRFFGKLLKLASNIFVLIALLALVNIVLDEQWH